MAKFSGIIGYGSVIETSPGIWEETIIDKTYYGDVTRNYRRNQNSNNVNDDIVISNEISIIADPFAIENFNNIKYVCYNNVKWKVTSIEIQYPRLLLTVGGVYNGE